MRALSVVVFSCVIATMGCADVGTQVRKRAAHDLSCREDKTRIVDAEAGVYRISGCGYQAGYHCSEDTGIEMRCQRLYLSKLDEPESKPAAGSNLAKTQ